MGEGGQDKCLKKLKNKNRKQITKIKKQSCLFIE